MSTKTLAAKAATNNLFVSFLKDIFLGWTKSEAIFGLSLVALQIITFIFNPESPLGFIAGTTGTICVLLVSKRKLSNYAFGLIQTAVTIYLGLGVSLWGESIENIFYFVSQIIGFAAWRKHMIAGDVVEEIEQVETRIFKIRDWFISLTGIALFTAIAGYIFQITNGTQPYIDSLTLGISIIAQIIMLMRYREQWVFWFVLNLVSLYQWVTLGNASLVALYIAMILNNAYGYYQWTKGAHK